MTVKVPRTTDDLEQELKDQLELLKLDVEHYDNGTEIAAKSMAAKLRILFHHKGPCHSLLVQTGKSNVLFHDTALEMDSQNTFSYSGLIAVSLDIKNNRSRYSAHLDDVPLGSSRRVEFDKWWNGIVFRDKEGNEFSRDELVRTLADQDGGTHVDPMLKKKYYSLIRQNALGWQSSTTTGTWAPLSNPHFAAVRQIVHETFKSLIPGYILHAKPDSSSRGKVRIAGMSISLGGQEKNVALLPPPSHSVASPKQVFGKVGRNNPCPCGSGKKYKKCHGW